VTGRPTRSLSLSPKSSPLPSNRNFTKLLLLTALCSPTTTTTTTTTTKKTLFWTHNHQSFLSSYLPKRYRPITTDRSQMTKSLRPSAVPKMIMWDHENKENIAKIHSTSRAHTNTNTTHHTPHTTHTNSVNTYIRRYKKAHILTRQITRYA
jgi:hypothetical protein